MATYKELDARIRELQREAAVQRKIEVAAAVRQIREMMQAYGLKESDLLTPREMRSHARGVRVSDKYRDPSTGKHWSGRGSLPLWLRDYIAKGRSIEDFRVR